MKSFARIAAAFMVAVMVTGCAGMGSSLASLGSQLTSSSPASVSTYADATLAATLATRTVDLAVNTANLDRATLTELGTLNDALHAAWLKLKEANDAKQSLTFASFNAALAAYQSYRTSQAIPEAPTS